MRIIFIILLLSSVEAYKSQLDSCLQLFTEISEVEIDSVSTFDDWVLNTAYYPSGRKKEETRYYVSEGCKTKEKCTIKYQRQIYYDQEPETFTLKEGKYLDLKNNKAQYSHYGYWYDSNAKLFRRVKGKTSKEID